MFWRRTDAVQDVGALILVGADATDRLARALAAKPAPFRALPFAHGRDWAALFAADDGEGTTILPHIGGAIPLHAVARDIWLPIGVAVDAPDHAVAELLAALCARHRVGPPVVILPSRDAAGEGDLFAIDYRLPFDRTLTAVA